MLGSDDYLISWGIYLVSALVCLFVWFRMTRFISVEALRDWMRVPMIVLLFLPLSVSEGSQALAPAVMALMFEILTGGLKTAERAGIPLLAGLVGAYLLVFTYHMKKINRAKNSKK